ncbi:N-acyl-D-amino-acid deacylase family protein [Metapseudomonas otitidis]|uniref:N-acyl-D-amino-acid deacylase family protein n=1 Tax=Metapseudomonas otitidis TaxID=319939 RepID=UPI0013F5B27B|nr:D-aminoacylase [Pseudomonas otitidis]
MTHYDTLIRNARVMDGSGTEEFVADVGLSQGRIAHIGETAGGSTANRVFDAEGLILAPGFIDAHTHDDMEVIKRPAMLPKLGQGVTTVIVGNCGISAAPVRLSGDLPDPMNLLGPAEAFRYGRFVDYRDAVEQAAPSVNVAALVGHTALRNNHLDRLDRSATQSEIRAMRAELAACLTDGAIGLSSGLAYASARAADIEEVRQLAEELALHGGLYATHLRDEFDGILDALDEAFAIGRDADSPVVVSHLKCAGAGNWGRSAEVLAHLEDASTRQPLGWDCYPYTASASTLDLGQVTDAYDILITWSEPHPHMACRTLADIAATWDLPLLETARHLQPAGAVYHCMSETDVQRILAHPLTMIGSDGLPEDPHPHPRLWGTFARVLGHYAQDIGLFSLEEAVRKMTSLPAGRFGLAQRGLIRTGHWADLVLFDPLSISDVASFADPLRPAAGIHAVWVNGTLAYRPGEACPNRAGRFLTRNPLERT